MSSGSKNSNIFTTKYPQRRQLWLITTRTNGQTAVQAIEVLHPWMKKNNAKSLARAVRLHIVVDVAKIKIMIKK